MLIWDALIKLKFIVIELKWLYQFIFKVVRPKSIKVLNMDKFYFHVKIQGLKIYLILNYMWKIKIKEIIIKSVIKIIL